MTTDTVELKAGRAGSSEIFGGRGRYLGRAGIVAWLVWYALVPSWPTPDKLFVLMVFGFMALDATADGVAKFAPFVATLFAYESFRGVADNLNGRVEFTALIEADRRLFGGELPTVRLQNWFYDGDSGAFEVAMYGVYMMHFVVPFALAFLIWWKRPQAYWSYASSIMVTSFAAFVTFLVFPAAPPWLAQEKGYVDGFVNLSAEAWEDMGLQGVPSLYGQVSPNLVAAIPSLHAAYATLVALFVFLTFGKRWGIVSLIYPIMIYFSTVYLGQHYLIDEFIGSAYAIAGYFTAQRILRAIRARRERKKVVGSGLTTSNGSTHHAQPEL